MIHNYSSFAPLNCLIALWGLSHEFTVMREHFTVLILPCLPSAAVKAAEAFGDKQLSVWKQSWCPSYCRPEIIKQSYGRILSYTVHVNNCPILIGHVQYNTLSDISWTLNMPFSRETVRFVDDTSLLGLFSSLILLDASQNQTGSQQLMDAANTVLHLCSCLWHSKL